MAWPAKWLPLLSAEILHMRFDNGEEDVLEVKKVEPEGDFLPPSVVSTVCCKVKGGKYSAELLAIEEATSKQCKVLAYQVSCVCN